MKQIKQKLNQFFLEVFINTNSKIVILNSEIDRLKKLSIELDKNSREIKAENEYLKLEISRKDIQLNGR